MARNFLLIVLIYTSFSVFGQPNSDKKAYLYTGIVYDMQRNPVPYTHVIARGTGQGDVTDSLGIFTIYIREKDQLSFYNLAFQDTTVWVENGTKDFSIRLKNRIYALRGARAFPWGSSYGEFMEEVDRLGAPRSIGADMGLPLQDPDVVPFDEDIQKLKSPLFMISSPVSYLYYNFSRREKNRRKSLEMDKVQPEIERFNAIVSRKNIAGITSLEGEALDAFLLYMNQRLDCDHRCSEVEVLTEVMAIWKNYQLLRPED